MRERLRDALGPEGHGHPLAPVWLGRGHEGGLFSHIRSLSLCWGHKAGWEISLGVGGRCRHLYKGR